MPKEQADTTRQAGPKWSDMPKWFWVAFAIVPLGMIAFTLPILPIADSYRWKPEPCVITRSGVATVDGPDGAGNVPAVAYSYEIGGMQYSGTRASFTGLWSVSGAAEIARRHPAGSKSICYVNPREEDDSVLERGFQPAMWWELGPLALAAIGISGWIASSRTAKRRRFIA